MHIQGPDPGFVRPIEPQPAVVATPNVQSVVAVKGAEDTQRGQNDVKFQDPSQDGRRSLYQESGGKYIGFYPIGELNLQRPLTFELDFGPTAAGQGFIIALEAFLETGFTSIHHSVGLTVHLPADEAGRVVASFPPLVKVLADPAGIVGFHVYAFPLGEARSRRLEASQEMLARPAGKGLNLRPRPGHGDRFDGSA